MSIEKMKRLIEERVKQLVIRKLSMWNPVPISKIIDGETENFMKIIRQFMEEKDDTSQ